MSNASASGGIIPRVPFSAIQSGGQPAAAPYAVPGQEGRTKQPESTKAKGVLMKVVHVKYDSYDIYIGRPSKWGNPFHIGVDGKRETVITKYSRWVQQQPELMAALHELQGKTLGCWCAPKLCHGDALIALVSVHLGTTEAPGLYGPGAQGAP